MVTNNKRDLSLVYSVLKYVSGILGILGIIIAVLTVTNVVDEILIRFQYPGVFGVTAKLILALSSAILGIFFLFISFSNYIDKFFGFLETHGVNQAAKDEEEKGVTFESIFFFLIGTLLVTLAVLLGIGYLVLQTNLPVLGIYTKQVLIGALIVLAILAYITAFNDIIGKSLKEMKKVYWPTGKEMADYSAKVFSFILFFSLLFLLLDLALTNLPSLITGWFE